jgi:hypothetical protein
MLHIGVDQHKRFSQMAVLDDDGRVLDERRLYHEDKEQLRRYFSSLPDVASRRSALHCAASSSENPFKPLALWILSQLLDQFSGKGS